MGNLFKKLTNKTIVLICGGALLLMVGVVILFVFNLIDESFFTIALFILLMVFSTLTSVIWQRKFEKRLIEKKKGELYQVDGEIKFNNPLKIIKANYGEVSLYLADKTLYALIKVVDADTFFSEASQQIKYNVDKKKYDNLIQFYIFNPTDINMYKKISIINYQAENFYVGSFIFDGEDNTIFQTEYIKPTEVYEAIYQNFLELINIKKN